MRVIEVFTVQDLLAAVAIECTDFRSVLNFSCTNRCAHAAVHSDNSLLNSWARSLTRMPLAEPWTDPLAVLRHVQGPSLVSTLVSRQWHQKTYRISADEEPLCTFTFTVEVGPLPGALHNPPQPLEMQDTCEDALGSSIGLQGKGIFSARRLGLPDSV